MGQSRAVLVLLAVALGLVACTGKDGEGDKVVTGGTITQELLGIHASTPIGCLKATGLSNIESRGRGFWRAENADPFFVVTVQRFSTDAKARSAVEQAVHSHGMAVGLYAVLGPLKGTNDGGVVSFVALCFGGSAFSAP